MEARALSEDEVKAYFSGDKITCFLCGKDYRRLAIHLPRIHNKTESEYKEMYGLPWRRGLTSKDSFENYRQATLKRIEDGYDPSKHAAKAREKMRLSPPKHRKRAPFIVKRNIERCLMMGGMPAQYTDADFALIVEELRKNRPLPDILKDEAFPGYNWLRIYCKKHPEAKTIIMQVVEKQPFAVQVKSQRLGKTFADAIRPLFEQGLSDHTIAAALGVAAMTVNKRTKPWRTQEKQDGSR